jgi:hypothetical protein
MVKIGDAALKLERMVIPINSLISAFPKKRRESAGISREKTVPCKDWDNAGYT